MQPADLRSPGGDGLLYCFAANFSCPIERDIATAACASLRQKAAYYWPSMSGYRELASRPPLNYDIKKSLPRLNALSMSS
jgi:hypothetical protein